MNPHSLSSSVAVRAWDWLTAVGTSTVDGAEARRVKLTNQGAGLIALFTLGFNILYAIYDIRALFPAILFNFICITVYGLVLVLNHKGSRLSSKSLMMVTGLVQLFVLCWLLSPKCGLNMFYFVTPVYCAFIFSASEKLQLFGLSVLAVVLYLLSYFLFSAAPGALDPDSSLLTIIYVSSFIGTFVLIGTFVWLFYSDILHAEKLLRVAHQRSESLLQNILPLVVIERLKSGETTIADRYPQVTVVFADIVGFTALAAALPPKELVARLNQVFSKFDKLADKYGVEKIKTIGDAYMVASGLPVPREDHAKVAAEFALQMQDAMKQSTTESGNMFQMRIGIHSGPAIAGVIGERKFSYDVWGDTVNTASRMESHGLPGKIQVSDETYRLLKGQFEFEERGWVEIKGKGKMFTYLLKGMHDGESSAAHSSA